jgi:uncharacterized protein (TIGR04255 family)
MTNTGGSKNPFVAHESIGEQRLVGNPLEVMFVQIQFSALTQFDGFADRIVRALRAEYPIQEKVAIQTVVVTPAKAVEVTTGHAWALRPVEPTMSLTIAPDSIALEFRKYPGRRHLLTILEHLVEVTAADADGPRAFTRLGVRAVNRFVNLSSEGLAERLRPAFLATSTVAQGLPDVEQIVAVSELHVMVGGTTRIQARWGSLPPNASPLPGDLTPETMPSWFLDIDAYSDTPAVYDPSTVAAVAGNVSATGYHFFRWATLDEYVTSLVEVEVPQ